MRKWFKNLRIRRKLLVAYFVIFVMIMITAFSGALALVLSLVSTQASVFAMAVLSVISAIVSVLLVLHVARVISEPITQLTDVAANVANGNLNVTPDTSTNDETGILAASLKRVIVLNTHLMDDLGRLDRAFRIDGDTTSRINTTRYIGAYTKMADEINAVLDYHVESKREILECITKIVGGDYDAPLRQYPGVESSINETVDYLRVSVRALEQVMKQKAEAETASQAKSSFLASMSHEIRTPMNSILGITEMLMDSEGLPENIEQGLITIYNSSNLLLGIINDILDFSKIEAGKLDIVPAQYELASLINDSTQLNMMRIENRAIGFELEINEEIPARLVGDELRIKEILNNLLSNAIKYTSTGKVTLNVDFKNNSGKDSVGTLVLSVSDTGYGMTPEQVDGLFTEYSRYNQQVSYSIEGTGLGLAITKRLIDLMHGDIHVESEVDVGSTFTVYLPQQLVDDEVVGSEVADSLRKFRLNYITGTKRPQTIRDPMPYGHVLIVDDVEPNLYVAEGIMRLYKLKIDTALSGFDAVEKVKSGNVYDVIFLDHMMPGMDGVDTLYAIRELGYKEPIVALTANAVAGQTETLMKHGFDDFISKPIDTRRLNTVLNKLVRDKQPAHVIDAARQEAEEERAKQSTSAGGSGNLSFSQIGRILSEDVYGLDVERGLEKFGGDEDAYVKTLRAYADTIGEMLSEIRNIRELDIHSYRINVHGIKGASYDIFANTAGMMAESLEKAAKADDRDYIAASNATFIYTVSRLISNIKEFLLQVESAATKPSKEKPDDEVLSKLLSACQKVSMDGVDDAMEEIEKYTYSSDDGLVIWLHESVEKMRFRQIAEKLTELGVK